MAAANFSEKSPRILVIRAGAIGDTLMATPLLRAVRQAYPNAYLGAICSSTAFNVLRCNPHLDEVFPITHRHLPGFLSLEKRRIANTIPPNTKRTVPREMVILKRVCNVA